MARKFTVKELASATGQAVGTVNKHFERKKFKKTRDGFVDPDTDFNKAYINSVTGGAGLGGVMVKNTASKSSTTKQDKPEYEVPNVSSSDKEFQELELRKKRSEVEISERRALLQQVELEKKAGNLLPVDVAERILIINIQAIFKAMENEHDSIVSIYSSDRAELAKISSRFRNKLADVVKNSRESAMQEIQLAIFEHQDVRGRGEKK